MAGFNITAVVGMVTTPYVRGLRNLQRFSRNAARIISAAFTVALTAGFVSLFRTVTQEFDKISKKSISLNIDPGLLQKLGVVGKLAGENLGDVGKAISEANAAAVAAQRGTGNFREQFEELNIEAERFLRLKPEDQLQELAAAYERSGGGAAAFNALQVIVGGNVSKLIPLLKLGKDGVRELLEGIEASDGISFEKITEFNDQLTLLENNLKSTAADVFPAATAAARTFFNVVQIGAKIIFAPLLQAFAAIQGIAAFFESGGGLIQRAKLAFEVASAASSALGESIREDIGDIGDAWDSMNRKASSGLDGLRDNIRENADVTRAAAAEAAALATETERLADAQKRYEQFLKTTASAQTSALPPAERLVELVRQVNEELSNRAPSGSVELFEQRIRILQIEQQIAATRRRIEESTARAVASAREARQIARAEEEILRRRGAGEEKGAVSLQRSLDIRILALQIQKEQLVSFRTAERLAKKRLELEERINEQQFQDPRKQAQVELDILALRVSGEKDIADALARQLKIRLLALEIQREQNIDFDRALEQATRRIDLEEALEKKKTRGQALIETGREIGARSPLSVALSGPRQIGERQLKEQEKTTAAVKEVVEKIDAIGTVGIPFGEFN